MEVKIGGKLKSHVGEYEIVGIKTTQKVWTKRKSDGYEGYFEIRDGVQYSISLGPDMVKSNFYKKARNENSKNK